MNNSTVHTDKDGNHYIVANRSTEGHEFRVPVTLMASNKKTKEPGCSH